MRRDLFLTAALGLAIFPGFAAPDPPAWGTGGESVIRDPKGETRLYTKESAGTALLNGSLVQYEEDKFPGTIVWGENNEVYVKDIIATMATDTYVKGIVEGDMITFEAGQLVEYVEPEDYDGVNGYGVGVGVARTEVNGNNVDFTYDPSVAEFRMKIAEDGSLSLVLPGEPFDGKTPPEYVLCYFYTDDFQFIGFSDYYQTYYPETYRVIEMPEGVETEQYVFVDEFDYANLVDVAYTDEYLYIRGLNLMMPESVVRAKIDGNKAVISQDEYMGIYMDLMFIFTKVYVANPDYNESKPGSIPYIAAPADMGYTLTLDREGGKITADTEGVYLSFQPGDDYAETLTFLSQFVLTYQSSPTGTPANPSRLKYLDNWVAYQGFADFQFNISNYSKEGTLLDVEHLYYQVLANGEPVIFGQRLAENLLGYEDEIYQYVPKNQRWLPYEFTNGIDIDKFGNSFDIGIYVPDVKTIGVQTLYIYDGVETYSDIVTLDVETGEIIETPASVDLIPESEIVKTEYYTLGGVKVANPDKGIYIKRVVYSNGKTSSVKVVY